MSDTNREFDASIMRRAVELAYRGRGFVESNPMVGCVVVKDGRVLAEGYHEWFGQAHAEVNALQPLSDEQRAGSTIYVTLEPCTHTGKTPPCIDLVVRSKPDRVVIGVADPNPQVAGAGITRLREAGIRVEVGIEEEACRRLIAPFAKRHLRGLPWIIGKWAMTLDGRMATHTGDSQWITGEAARRHAHAVRGKMDAIVVGIGTALADDPMLTARPPTHRIAKRIVIDSRARLPLSSKLVKTAHEIPTQIVCGPEAPIQAVEDLTRAGCLVRRLPIADPNERLVALFQALSLEDNTNVLIDGGPKLLGALFDRKLIDEVHVYIGGKLVGGPPRLVPNQGIGLEWIKDSAAVTDLRSEVIGGDIFVRATL